MNNELIDAAQGKDSIRWHRNVSELTASGKVMSDRQLLVNVPLGFVMALLF
jgi:hypothetical protein